MTALGPLAVPVLAGLSALVLVCVLTEAVRRFALRHGFTDQPSGRKAHTRPTPTLGGVAIAAGTLLPVSLLTAQWDRRLAVIVVASAVIAALGTVDDLASARPVTRLCVEAAAAAAVVASGVRIELFGNGLDAAVTVCWVVVITNAFNLLDNMDGAAATVALVTASALAASALLVGSSGIAVLMSCLAAGCGGFLVHNWAPARIFMGDTGSLFLGFVIGTSAVVLHGSAGSVSAVAALLLVTFVATVDTCLVMVSRRRAGRSWWLGGTDHVAHRLRRLGLGVRRVVLLLAASAAASCLFGALVVHARLSGPAALVAAVLTGLASIWALLRIPADTAWDEARTAPVTGKI